MLKRILFSAAGLAGLFASPAQAQVVGEWQYEAIAGTPSSIRITRDRAHPDRMTGVGDLNGSLIVFVGEFRNLKWYGTWYWYGPRNVRLPGLRTCAELVSPRPGTPGYGQQTAHRGGFELTFNAGETQLRGTWKSACSGPDGRTESSLPITFSANRMNTYTAAAPQSVPYVGTVAAAPPVGSPGTRPRPMDIAENDDRPCSDIAAFRISGSGTRGVPDTVFSTRYRLRPCMTTAGKTVQIDLLNPEAKRPMRVVLQGLRISSSFESGPRKTIQAIPTGVTFVQGLPFIGEPRAGQVLGRIPMAGRICSAPMWLVWLDFSDGTRSREPIGTLFSVCGLELNRDMVPPAMRPGGGDGPRPAGTLRPKGT
jgi:hypothetical protein